MDKDYTSFQKFGHRLASTGLISKFNAKMFPPLDRLLFRLTGGRYTALSIISGLPLVMVDTIGAKSGLKRTIPLLCIREKKTDTEFAITASNWGKPKLPAWYYNLKANPEVTCTIQGKTRTYLATEASGEDYRHYWKIAERIYVGYPKYKNRAGRHIPILMMTPVTPES